MPGLPLSQAIEVVLAWIELDRHASTGTVATCGFSDFVGGDAGIPNIAELDRDILRGYQRHLPGRAPAQRRLTAAGHLHPLPPPRGAAQLVDQSAR